MTTNRVLVTTAWLNPGDEVHQLLTSAGYDVVHSSFQDRAASGESLVDIVPGFSGIIAGTDTFSADVLAAADDLRVLGRTGVGYDNIDVDAATKRGVAVCPTPGVNRQSVAEHAVALMLNCARLIPQNIHSIRNGAWPQVSGRELSGSTLGLVGLGAIGKAVARIALGFGMHVVAYDPYFDAAFAEEFGIQNASLDELFAVSDFVSLHIFLDASTHHLVNAEAIRKMKDGAIIINTARGGVIDEDALADALEQGKLAGAGLDVVENEPLPADSRLRSIENLVITAHIAAATRESRARSGMMAAQSVIDVLGGRVPRQTVNPQFESALTANV